MIVVTMFVIALQYVR